MKFRKKVLTVVGCLVCAVFLSCASSVTHQTPETEPNLEPIIERGKAGTVQIGNLSVEGPPSSGSGFFIGEDLIVTNVHVMNERSFEGAVSIAKVVNKPTWYTITGVMASDPKRDLVILKVAKVSGEDPPILSLGDSDAVKVKDPIIAIGNPLQDGEIIQGDVSEGTISRWTPHFLGVHARNIRKGYSGGPVLNVHGEVIGVIFRRNQVEAGYAVPSNYLRALLKDMPTSPKSLEDWREEPLIRYHSAVEIADRGDFAQALSVYDTVIQLAPDFAHAYTSRGNARKALGDLEGAIQDYDTAIRLGADYAFVYLNRGRVKADLEDDAGAIADYDRVIQLKPGAALLAAAYLNRGNVKGDLEDDAGAIADYDRVIQLKPGAALLAAAYFSRGSAKEQLGDYTGVIEDCDTAIRLEPVALVRALAYNLRGIAKSAQGDPSGSIPDYDTALQLEPNNPVFYYNRGVAHAALGHPSAAETDLTTALRLLDQGERLSTSVDEETILHLTWSVRSDLRVHIEAALRGLE